MGFAGELTWRERAAVAEVFGFVRMNRVGTATDKLTWVLQRVGLRSRPEAGGAGGGVPLAVVFWMLLAVSARVDVRPHHLNP